MSRSRAAILACVLAALAGPAAAAGFGEFDGALRSTWDGVRAAQFYLRTGNPMVAELELAAARAHFDEARAGQGALPEPYGRATSLAPALSEIGRRLDEAGAALAEGDLEAAAATLAPVGAELARGRREAGVWWFSDCVAEMNEAMARLRPFDRPDIDLAAPATADAVKEAAAVAVHVWSRCHALAPPAVGESGEFERLAAGALASLPLIRAAVDGRDPDRLHLILIELWSFDRLLWLRYG
jgi:hypothetical protein